GLYIGNEQIIDNHPERGVSIISLKSFLNGRKLERIVRYQGDSNSRNHVIRKAQSMLGVSYHLTKFNCEHFVNEVWGAGRKSQQLATAGLLFFFSLAVWGLSKTN
ncbi:MAG: lecithin retinol acyltransferase family protein, partial [Fulvivirga sp.]